MRRARTAPHEEGMALGRRLGYPFIETSATTAQNVEQLFVEVVRMLQQRTSNPLKPEVEKKKKTGRCIIA
ncbi:hypothetical protein FB451DRAFT_1240685 [Mycena latifolia]|nr:hypothetical protein FB451DRAFT_1240685 [Mycena latifolia]